MHVSSDDVLPSADEVLVQRHADGELRPAEARAFEARLLEEPELVRMLERLVSTRRAFRHAAPEPAPLGAGFADRVFTRLQQPEAPEADESAEPASAAPREVLEIERTLRNWVLLAASILLLLGALAFFTRSDGSSGVMMADDAPAENSRVLRELDDRARALDAQQGREER